MLLLQIIAGFMILYIVIKVASWFGSRDNSPVSLDSSWDQDNLDDSDGSDSGSSDSNSGDSGGGDWRLLFNDISSFSKPKNHIWLMSRWIKQIRATLPLYTCFYPVLFFNWLSVFNGYWLWGYAWLARIANQASFNQHNRSKNSSIKWIYKQLLSTRM